MEKIKRNEMIKVEGGRYVGHEGEDIRSSETKKREQANQNLQKARKDYNDAVRDLEDIKKKSKIIKFFKEYII